MSTPDHQRLAGAPGRAPLERLAELGVVPVVAIEDPGGAAELGAALVEAGLPVLELTFRTAAAAASIAALRGAHPEILIVAGTLTERRQADEAREAGADLLVSPGLNPAVVEHAQAAGIPILPGIATPSEVELAISLGLGAVKVFPAEQLGGPPFLRALSGPFGQMGWSPSGGISPDNLAGYLQVRSALACGGSWIAPRAEIAAGRFEGIRERAAAALDIVRSARVPDAAGTTASGSGAR